MARIVLGALGILIGIGVVALGAGALWSEQAVSAFLNAGEGRSPGTVRFTAEDRDYTVVLGSGGNGPLTRDSRCTVTRANESVVKLRGDRTRVQVNERTIGEFQGIPGTTTVECTFVERDLDLVSARFYVAPQREWLRTLGFVGLGGGVLVILMSVFLILAGVRSRASPAAPAG